MISIRYLAITLCLSCTAVADEVSDTVSLNFDWNTGLQSRGEAYAERIKVKNGEQEVQMTMTADVQSRIESHSEGFLLIQDTNNVEFDADFGEMSDYMKPMMESVSSIEIQAVISSDGELLSVEGMEPIISGLNESMDLIIKDAPDEIKPMLNNLKPQLVSEDKILSQVYESWDSQFGQWVGAEFEKGYYYNVEYTEQIEEFGGVELGVNGSYEYLGKINCNEKDSEQSCVELTFSSSLEPESAKQLTNAIMEQMNIPVPEGFTMEVATNILLITEPSTLKPHYYEKVRKILSPNTNEAGTEELINRFVYNYYYE